ncbi:MAG: type II secretion system protein [Pseudomonadota bacterium]|nr:type II secretion system protein [Pseudomonadota bacterium]
MYINHKGMTLIELVMAIALAGILVAALMSSYSSIVGRSADPMIRVQSIAIAESYLEEVLQKPFLDSATNSRCPGATGGRSTFNNVCDYNGYSSSSITLPNGSAVSSLNGYSVSISVADIAVGELGAIPTHCALKVTVTVTNPIQDAMSLTGYRTDYESDPDCS